MTNFIKFLACASGLIGSCCSVAFPVSMAVKRSSDNTVNNFSGGGTSHSSSIGVSHSNDQVQNYSLSYDNLWDKINQDYQKVQTDNNQILNWKDDFQKVLEQSEPGSKWRHRESLWKNCHQTTRASSTYCGFLWFDNLNFQYKVKVSYDTDDGSSYLWRVMVTKNIKNDNIVQYWDLTDSQWKSLNSSQFTSFVSFNQNNNNDEWQKLLGPSIKKELTPPTEEKNK